MDSDIIIREEGAESAAPEEVMTSGFPTQEEPAAPQEAGGWESGSGSGYSAEPGGNTPAGDAFGGGTGSDTPAGGGYGGGRTDGTFDGGGNSSGGYSGGVDNGPGSEPPVNRKSFIRACGLL